MSKGLFSRIEADRFLDDQSSLMDVINASLIDRVIGFQANPLEEIGHAGVRKVTKGGLFGLFNLFLHIILKVLYALNVAFQKMTIVRWFFYIVGVLFVVLLPCCIFIDFSSDNMQGMVILCSIFLLYILYKSHSRKLFCLALLSFFLSSFMVLDVHYLHIVYTPIEKYYGIWVSPNGQLFVKVEVDSTTGNSSIASNVLEHRPESKYFHVHGYNFIYLYDRNDKSNTHLFLYYDSKLIYEPFFSKHEIFSRKSQRAS